MINSRRVNDSTRSSVSQHDMSEQPPGRPGKLIFRLLTLFILTSLFMARLQHPYRLGLKPCRLSVSHGSRIITAYLVVL